LLQKRIASALAVVAPDGGRIARCGRDGKIPASFSQARMWLVHQVHPGIIAYNSQVAVHFTGPLDTGALRRSLDDIVRRHEIYRTSLAEEGGQIVQRIHEVAPASLTVIDLETSADGPSEAALRRTIEEEIARPFHLDQPPLVRWTLIRLGSEKHTLLCMDHHAVGDGWSRHVVLGELMALYRHHRSETGAMPLPPPPIQFADFAAWQHTWIHSAEARTQVAFWKNRLQGATPLLDLPLDRPRPMRPSFRGGHELMTFEEAEMEPLRKLGEQEQATMYMLFLAGFLSVLARHCRTEDISIGSGIANRRMPETDGLVGMLINMVVMRANLSGKPTFLEWLRRVRAMTLEAYAHQEAPFEKVVEAVAPPRDPRVNPLHQVTFNFQNNPMPAMDFPGLEAELERPLFNGSAKFDLYVAGWPRSPGRVGGWQRDDHAVLLSWEYNADVFEAATIHVLQDHFRRTLARAAADPGVRLADLLDGAEAARSIGMGAKDRVPQWSGLRVSTIHGLFEEQAAIRPEAIAVECGELRLGYAELDLRANALARSLRAAGVGRDVPVGLLAQRSVEMVIGLLGILKAGGCYVPLDIGFPAKRLAFMVAKVGLQLVVGPDAEFASLEGALPGCRHIRSDGDETSGASDRADPSDEAVDCESLAYVLFTSGSSGEPRAVAVPHRAVVRLVKGQDFAVMDERQAWLHHSPLSFDASTLEIWAALCNGSRLVVLPRGPASLDEIARVVRESAVTSLWLTAGVFRLMASERAGDLAGLSQILTGGDVVSMEGARRVRAMHPGLRLVNGYGPTENTTFTCCQEIGIEDLQRRSLPIGRAIRGTSAWILDEDGRASPTGIAGELCAGGSGLARGYWRDEAATAERFVEHPRFGRLYRTGDLCRMLPDGRIEFLGRLDRQTKVRGVRIEPAEIESALERCEGVAASAVVPGEDAAGERILMAYVVPADPAEPLSADFLRRRLKAHLPDLLLPSRFVMVERLPVTPNGKVDYRALPAPGPWTAPGKTDDAEFSEGEAAVSAIWEEVLGVAALGRHDDFFVLGGHSLAVLRVLAMLRDRTGVELQARQFFEDPTVCGIAAAVEQATGIRSRGARTGEMLLPIGEGRTGPAIVFIPGGWGEENEILVFAALIRRMKTRRPCYAARSGVLDEDASLAGSLDEQADRMVAAMRAKGAKGPLALVGECAASTLALAVTAKLEALGELPDSLTLLDPGPASHLESLKERLRAAGPAEGPGAPRLPARVEHYYGMLGELSRNPVNCPLHIILSSRFADTEAVRASWMPMAGRSLSVHRVAGDHHSYIRDTARDTAHLLDRIVSPELSLRRRLHE
jgi:amino acid adenylation domain-containing protein